MESPVVGHPLVRTAGHEDPPVQKPSARVAEARRRPWTRWPRTHRDHPRRGRRQAADGHRHGRHSWQARGAAGLPALRLAGRRPPAHPSPMASHAATSVDEVGHRRAGYRGLGGSRRAPDVCARASMAARSWRPNASPALDRRDLPAIIGLRSSASCSARRPAPATLPRQQCRVAGTAPFPCVYCPTRCQLLVQKGLSTLTVMGSPMPVEIQHEQLCRHVRWPAGLRSEADEPGPSGTHGVGARDIELAALDRHGSDHRDGVPRTSGR